MRGDRYSTLRQRLRREADAFEFGALKEGVSTLAESSGQTRKQNALLPTQPEEHIDTPEPGNVPGDQEIIGQVEPLLNGKAALEEALPGEDPARVRAALEAMAAKMLTAAAHFEAALRERSAVSAGKRLAQLNEVLVLLRSADSDGDLARRLNVRGAPPQGRSWPAPVWSVAEFAASPFSGLLPSDADECFARTILYSAWGIELE